MNRFFIYHIPVFSCCSMVAGLKKDSLFKILLITDYITSYVTSDGKSAFNIDQLQH